MNKYRTDSSISNQTEDIDNSCGKRGGMEGIYRQPQPEDIRETGQQTASPLTEMTEMLTDLIPEKTEPDPEDSRTDPAGAGRIRADYQQDEQKELVIPDLVSMTKYFCRRHKLELFSYLNRCLRDGSLARIVGFPVSSRRLNRDSCFFEKFTYWKIDRTSFLTDISVRLRLDVKGGTREWNGTLSLWCSFEEEEEQKEQEAFLKSLGMETDQEGADSSEPDDGFYFNIDELVPGTPSRNGFIMLSPFLIPYYRNPDIERQANELWRRYLPEALQDPAKRDAAELADRMGLKVIRLPLYNRKDTGSILFFREDVLVVRDINAPLNTPPDLVRIGADTIVINTNTTWHNYPQYDTFHECIHYEEHYLFYRLQGLPCNDTLKIKRRRVPVSKEPADQAPEQTVHAGTEYSPSDSQNSSGTDQGSAGPIGDGRDGSAGPADSGRDGSGGDAAPARKQSSQKKKKPELRDPVYFMEYQANRGALALWMPAENMRGLIGDAIKKAVMEKHQKRESFRHEGQLLQEVGIRLSMELHVPHFRIRTRFIQLGYIEAKGALNYVDKKMIEPFACDPEAWKEICHTYVLNWKSFCKIMMTSEDFSILINSGEYVYADGHVVKNKPRYVYQKTDPLGEGALYLTDWANAHVDLCCLRFVRVYVQKDIGKYEFGRMYYDAEFVRRTNYFVNDFINRQKIGDIGDVEARMLYRDNFPKNFTDAFQCLRVANKMSMEKMAGMLNMDHNTLKRWITDPSKYRNENFLVAVALILQLPDWISLLLFKRASFFFNDYEPRHMALQYIIRAKSCDGIAEANEYLQDQGFAPLWGIPDEAQ